MINIHIHIPIYLNYSLFPNDPEAVTNAARLLCELFIEEGMCFCACYTVPRLLCELFIEKGIVCFCASISIFAFYVPFSHDV